MGRSILAVVAGLVLGVVIIAAVEYMSHMVYPPPPGLDMKDPEAMKAMVANLPVGALLFLLLAWALGSFGGGWLAARLSQRLQTRHAMIVGALLMLAGIMNMIMIPHPAWLWVLGIAVYLPAAYLGARLVKVRQA
jgi:4-hydroxybenzoate polyprenyltransferase